MARMGGSGRRPCHVLLDGFDSLALERVLNIVHHRADLNPKHVTVEELAKIAVKVD